MTPEDWRALADQAKQEAIELAKAGDLPAAARRSVDAQRFAATADEIERLTSTNQPHTVGHKMVGAVAKQQEWRKPPSLRELAKMLGCTQGFLSQARKGDTRIRLSWAQRIAAVRPDMPPTKKTWPKGWAPEQG